MLLLSGAPWLWLWRLKLGLQICEDLASPRQQTSIPAPQVFSAINDVNGPTPHRLIEAPPGPLCCREGEPEQWAFIAILDCIGPFQLESFNGLLGGQAATKQIEEALPNFTCCVVVEERYSRSSHACLLLLFAGRQDSAPSPRESLSTNHSGPRMWQQLVDADLENFSVRSPSVLPRCPQRAAVRHEAQGLEAVAARRNGDCHMSLLSCASTRRWCG